MTAGSLPPDNRTRPLLVTSERQLRELVHAARERGCRVGVVPTMGALHAGHLSLVDYSVAECGFSIVTIFVNPTQFGPSEDFDKYPRTLDADLDMLTGHGVDAVFAPPLKSVYPPGFASYVEPQGVAVRWEGACRPGHFRGVATVVLKLFNQVDADVAYFGRKDLQQCRVIEQMARDLDLKVKIRVCPLVREGDGLALSSRNVYLSADERQRALTLSRVLTLARNLVAAGKRDVAEITHELDGVIRSVAGIELEYLAIVDPQTLEPLEQVSGPAAAIVAARVGKTRLIDNEWLEPPRQSS